MESKELKVGDTATYQIAGKTITLKPVTLGRMKKAMTAFAIVPGKNTDTFDMMQEHLYEILSNGDNAFATREWIGNNVTMPVASQIISDMRIVNGLEQKDFFSTGSPAKETRELNGQATPSA